MAVQYPPVPMEMGKYLRQHVDNSFEEGQFESAVAILDQMRSPDHRPSIIHLLHLIFISLHSSTKSCRLDTEGTDAADDLSSLLKSPRKMVKAAKSAISLSPEAVYGAQRLLFSFLDTNGPNALNLALPQYPESEAAKRQMGLSDGGGVQFGIEYLDTPIYAQALAVKLEPRSVWEVIKEGFTERASARAAGLNNKGKARARTSLKPRGLTKDGSLGDLGDDEEPKIVGDDSWTFLEWVVALFEKDENEMEHRGSGKYSPLLLRQLPPPPGGSNTRFDASEPLKVAIYALEQDDRGRQSIGSKLLELLLHLTYSQYLNLPSFTAAVIAQLTSCSPESLQGTHSNSPDSAHTHDIPSPSTRLTTLLDLLPSTTETLPFKVALCYKILQDVSGLSSSSRPAPRARPPTSRNGKAVNGNADEPPPPPDLGINPATGRPIISAMKKPKPRLRSNTVTTSSASVADSSHAENTATVASNAPIPPPMAMAPSASGGSSVVTATSGSSGGGTIDSKASAPARNANPRPQIPRFADVAQAAKAQVQQAEARQTRNGAGRQNGHAQQTMPWGAPAILMRVRYELILACVETLIWLSLRRGRAEQPLPPPPPSAGSGSGEDAVSDWEQAVKEADGRLATLIEQVFDSPRSGESQNEKEDRQLYANLIRAHAKYRLKDYKGL